MKLRWLLGVCLCLCALSAVGCGVRAMGPANPDEVPTVPEEEVEKQWKGDMPPEVLKQYQQGK